MDDKERTAIETEISTERGIIKDAEAIIGADEAKLAAGKAASAEAKDIPLSDTAQGGDKPAQEAAAPAPENQPGTAGAPAPMPANPAPEAEPAAAPAPEPTAATAAPEAAQAAPVASAPAAEAPATDLSPGRVTPLPANELGPIIIDTAEAGAGEIVKPQRPEWSHRSQPPSMGRIVHYRAANSGESPDGNEFHAALITKVNEDWSVGLSVFPEGRNPMFVSNVAFGDGDAIEDVTPGMWGWPARV